MDTIGSTLRKLREEKGLLLRQVAAATDLDSTMLSKIECEDRLPTKQQLEKLSKFYKADINEMTAAWLADRIVRDLMEEKMALRAMKMAEQKINSLKKSKI